ncbi:MAG: hypothetical protein ACI9SP_003549 [Arenicella sp.]|jgi:hypothetical protein
MENTDVVTDKNGDSSHLPMIEKISNRKKNMAL